jgi:hypothetical protein
MNDWIGLGIIISVLLGGILGLGRVSQPPAPLTQDEFERRVKESRGWMSTGVNAAMHGIQELLHPEAVKAIAVQKDLRQGFYDDQQEMGEGHDPGSATNDLKSSNAVGEGDA